MASPPHRQDARRVPSRRSAPSATTSVGCRRRGRATRFSTLLPFDRMHAVFDDGRLVAGGGRLPVRADGPGRRRCRARVSRSSACCPSHRRRGLLRRMMEAQLRDVRERDEPIAALWASEETIYGRYGYGLASLELHVDAERDAVAIRAGASTRRRRAARRARRGAARLPADLRARQAQATRDDRPHARLVGGAPVRRHPDRRRGGGPLVRALSNEAAVPVGYALYRMVQEGSTPADWKKTMRVIEAFGVDRAATRDIWRFLLEIDWVDRIAAYGPAARPPAAAARGPRQRAEPDDSGTGSGCGSSTCSARSRRARTASGARRSRSSPTRSSPTTSAPGRSTTGGRQRRRRRPDVRLPVDALGAVFLGGFTFARLVAAGLAEEGSRGGAARADAVFATPLQPWCPENF